MAKGTVVSKAEIVKSVKDAFDPEDIDKVWSFLGKKFHFNIPAWKTEFEKSLDTTIRDKTVQIQFMEFGKRRIEPLLNEILHRERYPTWIYLLAHLLNHKIEVSKMRNRRFEGRY